MHWFKFKKFKDRKVDITIKDQTFKGKTLKFVGINSVGHKVVACINQSIFFIDNWNDLHIADYQDERIFKD